MRVFFSFHVPDIVGEECRRLFSDLPVRPYPIANMHITIKFIGVVHKETVAILSQIGQVVAEYVPPIHIVPTKFYVERGKIKLALAGSPLLKKIHDAMSAQLTALHFESTDRRTYTPHITLGHAKPDFLADSIIVNPAQYRFTTHEFHLYETTLQADDFPIYTPLKTFHLRGT